MDDPPAAAWTRTRVARVSALPEVSVSPFFRSRRLRSAEGVEVYRSLVQIHFHPRLRRWLQVHDNMRHLVIVRHAIAHERDRARWPDDAQRPLSATGAKKLRSTARAPGKLVGAPDALLTSPFKRARQTARILKEEAGFPKPLRLAELRPAARASALIAALDKQRGRRLVIVGHDPALSALLTHVLLRRSGELRFQFKKGGCAWLQFDDRIRAGKGELIAFAPPRLLRERRGR